MLIKASKIVYLDPSQVVPSSEVYFVIFGLLMSGENTVTTGWTINEDILLHQSTRRFSFIA